MLIVYRPSLENGLNCKTIFTMYEYLSHCTLLIRTLFEVHIVCTTEIYFIKNLAQLYCFSLFQAHILI